ncbi:hypothetical protein PspLS_01797 [Pyricularia sp. CBS 133598]|nr:hypothetical protein PspLS_01797 [Pyricularia sp. CBS 133598]
MHILKVTTQIITMLALGAMALPTPASVPTAQKKECISAGSDGVREGGGEASNAGNSKLQRRIEYVCGNCQKSFSTGNALGKHQKKCDVKTTWNE